MWALAVLTILLLPVAATQAPVLDLAARTAIFLPVLAAAAFLAGRTRHVMLAAPVYLWLGAWGVALGPIHLSAGLPGLLAGAVSGAVAAALVARWLWRMAAPAGPGATAAAGLLATIAMALLLPHLAALTGGPAGLPVAPPSWLADDLPGGVLPRIAVTLPPSLAGLGGVGPTTLMLGGTTLDGGVALYAAVVVLALLLAWSIRRLSATPLGAALRGLQEAPEVAAAVGLDPARLSGRAVGLAAGTVGLCGALFALWQGRAEPGALVSIPLLLWLGLALLIGGLVRPAGALFGAVTIAGGPPLLALAPTHAEEPQGLPGPLVALMAQTGPTLWLGLALVLVALLLPGGLGGVLSRRPRRRTGPGDTPPG